MCTGSQGKAKAPKESGLDVTAVIGGSSGKTEADCAFLWGKINGDEALGNIYQCVFLWRWPF